MDSEMQTASEGQVNAEAIKNMRANRALTWLMFAGLSLLIVGSVINAMSPRRMGSGS